jgi:hypothetical protein
MRDQIRPAIAGWQESLLGSGERSYNTSNWSPPNYYEKLYNHRSMRSTHGTATSAASSGAASAGRS